MRTLDEVGRQVDAVRAQIELLCVRGLASSTPKERRALEDLSAEWDRLGAVHVSSRLRAGLAAIDKDSRDAPSAVLSAYSSLHVFERLLSLGAAVDAWEAQTPHDEAGAEDVVALPAALDRATPTAPAVADPEGALGVLADLGRTVEDLLRTGLTSATKSTREKLDASFKEASRRKLLRLGAALRYVNEEIGRFLADDGSFSARRFAFFLHRSWLLARGIARGIRDGDAKRLGSLVAGGGAAPVVVPWIEVVTLGALKRTLVNAATFDFRLRIVAASDTSLVGRPLVYSLVFPRKKDAGDLPAEAYLHLPQPQRFVPKVLTDGMRVRVTEIAIAGEGASARLVAGPKTTMTQAGEQGSWRELYTFDARAALARARAVTPGPLDLAVELQEEVFVRGATISDEPIHAGDGKRTFSLIAESGLALDAAIPDGAEGEALLGRLREGLRAKARPILYGLVHYELGRLVMLPLSLMPTEPRRTEEAAEEAPTPKKKGAKKEPKKDSKGSTKTGDEPDLITLSEKRFDVSALVGALGL
jgi:hypothetical protein